MSARGRGATRARGATARRTGGQRAGGQRTGGQRGGGRRGGGQPARRRAGGGALRQAARGDRPYVVALFALVVLIGAMALGPLQNFTAAADRVETLERTRDQLRAEVDTLEDRRARLHDPDEIETLARTELNLVRPGEIPFVVVTPDEVAPQVGPGPPGDGDEGELPWYRRFGRWLGERFGAEP